MTFLAFIFALEAGFQSSDILMFTAPGFDAGSLAAGYAIDSSYVQMEAAGELFNFLRVGGSAQIYMADTDGWTYAPYDARFLFFFRATLAGFTLGFEHLCIHPLDSPGRPDFGWLYGGGNRMYLRYEAKIGGR